MINFFPAIYPDELLYSQLARYYTKSGYLTYTAAAQDLFVSKTVRPDAEFINAYSPDALQAITRTTPIETIIMRHTMFPYYGRFISPERRVRAFQSLLSMGAEYHTLLSIPKNKNRTTRYLRYCPLCADKDRSTYGETYWHRLHQMVGVNICPVHHCFLINSNIAIGSNVSPSLTAAENTIKIPQEIMFSKNKLECNLAEYIADVFFSDVNLQSDVTTGRFLHASMEGTKYLSQRGEQRNIALFHADFTEFYQTLPNSQFNQLWQLQKVFTNDRHNTHEVCMMAMFLNIPAANLVNMTLPDQPQHALFDEKIRALHAEGLNYQQIATQLNASYNVIKAIGEGLYGKYHYNSSAPKTGGAKKHDWNKIDLDMLPQVKDAICKLQRDGITRPIRITAGAVERYLNLPKKGLKHCPKCLAEIAAHYETQEQYWARAVVWAASSLIRNGQAFNLTNIKKLTNMRTQYYTACAPYLGLFADKNMVDKIRELL